MTFLRTRFCRKGCVKVFKSLRSSGSAEHMKHLRPETETPEPRQKKTHFYILLKMDKVINLGIPHVGEKIFRSINTDGLIQCLAVSQSWKVMVENVLLKRWNGNLREACRSGKTEIVRILLESGLETGLNKIVKHGRTLLQLACLNGHKEVAKLLIDHGADVNAKGACWDYAINCACIGEHTDIVKLILDYAPFKRIEFNKKDIGGRNAILWSCEVGNTDIVKVLLDYSDTTNPIDWNIRNDVGRTAFMLACFNGYKDIVKLILDHSDSKNIDLDARDDDGRTAFELASIRIPYSRYEQTQIIELLELRL